MRESGKVYFHVSLANPKASTNINDIFWTLKSSKLKLPGEVSVQAISPHPFDKDKFIISTKASIYVVDIKQLSISQNGEGTSRIIKEGSSIYMIREDSLDSYNVTLRTSSPVIGIKDADKISVSPNGRKIAILWKSSVLEIYDTDTKRSLRFDISDIGYINDLFWHKTSAHMFLTAGSDLYFAHVEKEGLSPQKIYEGMTKAIYSDGQLYVLSNKEVKTLKF
jgi:tricorn protease-like protein